MKHKSPFTAWLLVVVAMVTFSCNQQPKEAPKEDPRMAGFKGKIAKKFEDSKEDAGRHSASDLQLALAPMSFSPEN